jgi:integrase/recombinase XerD
MARALDKKTSRGMEARKRSWGKHELGRWGEGLLAWQRERGYAARTVRMLEVYLRYFFAWCEARGLLDPGAITRPILERYQKHLYLHRKADGNPLSWRGQGQRVRAVQAYFRWLMREGVLLSNPAADLVLPRQEYRLPKAILTEEEVERVLLIADVTTPHGLRERAMLEVMYATGIRRTELVELRVDGVDRERAVIWVRQGKGKKDRVVPLGERALSWVERYLKEARGELACGRDEGALFLSFMGGAIAAEYWTHRVRRMLKDAKIDKPGSCHLFRHTMATLMLEGGADVRYVQEMLGHANLATTQIYTHVSVKKLQEVHAASHPGAKLKKP